MSSTSNMPVTVPLEFLQQVLDQLEGDWDMIDSAKFSTKGGLEAAIAKGEEPVITEVRRLIADAMKSAQASSATARTPGTYDGE